METCQNCDYKGLSKTDYLCTQCGFPQNGTQAEKKNYFHTLRLKKEEILEKSEKLKFSNYQIILNPILLLLVSLYFFFYNYTNYTQLITSILSTILLLLLITKNKKKIYLYLKFSVIILTSQTLISVFLIPDELFTFVMLYIMFLSVYISRMSANKRIDQLRIELKEETTSH